MSDYAQFALILCWFRREVGTVLRRSVYRRLFWPEFIGTPRSALIDAKIVCIGALIGSRQPEEGWRIDALGAPHMREQTEAKLTAILLKRSVNYVLNSVWPRTTGPQSSAWPRCYWSPLAVISLIAPLANAAILR